MAKNIRRQRRSTRAQELSEERDRHQSELQGVNIDEHLEATGIVPLKRQQIYFNSLAFHDCGKCILLEVLYSLVLYKFFPIDDQNKIFVYNRSICL